VNGLFVNLEPIPRSSKAVRPGDGQGDFRLPGEIKVFRRRYKAGGTKFVYFAVSPRKSSRTDYELPRRNVHQLRLPMDLGLLKKTLEVAPNSVLSNPKPFCGAPDSRTLEYERGQLRFGRRQPVHPGK
jgi:hypothetical protein